MTRRNSYISVQLGAINDQLQQLFEELGLNQQDRELRERNLYSAISDTLLQQVETVKKERDDLIQTCSKLQFKCRDLLSQLKDIDVDLLLGANGSKLLVQSSLSPPYAQTYSQLEAMTGQINQIHQERYKRYRDMVDGLDKLRSKIDGFQVHFDINTSESNLDLSASNILNIENEIQSWQKEYKTRISTVAQRASEVVSLWAELGTAQDIIDRKILSCYKTNPEALGTQMADIQRLESLQTELKNEKEFRQQKLTHYREQVVYLWNKLSEDPQHIRNFESSNRGLATSVLTAYEKELDRLNDKKRHYIHVFIADARHALEDLWQKLYFSEEERNSFTPAWTDILTDASLDAHESEITRLEGLLKERQPILNLIMAYRDIQREAQELEKSTQDSSRLLSRGSGKRDPSRLLREEQMRKRIAKRMPKVLIDLKNALVAWQNSTGKPFLVKGQNFLITLNKEDLDNKRGGKTPRRQQQQPSKPLNSNVRANSPSKSQSRQMRPPALSTNSNSQPRPLSSLSSLSSNRNNIQPLSSFNRPKQPNFSYAPDNPPYETPVRHNVYGPSGSTLKAANSRIPGIVAPTVRSVSGSSSVSTTLNSSISSTTSSTTRSAASTGENWEMFRESSSDDDQDEIYERWRNKQVYNLAHNSENIEPAFNYDKDTF